MGYLVDSIDLVRTALDDPATNANYTDAKIIRWLEASFSTIVPHVFRNASGPNGVRWNLAVVADQESYAKPPHVMEIWGAHKVDSKGNIEGWLRPRSPFNPYGPGILLEGNRISFIPKPAVGETLRIWYVPDGSIRLSEGPVKTGSTTSAVKLDTPAKGSLDLRDNAYSGYILTITASNGKIEERMANTSSFDTDSSLTVAPDFTVTVDATATYEVTPVIGQLFQSVVALDASLTLLAFQGESKKTAMIERRVRSLKAQLIANAAHEEQIVGGHFAGDVLDNSRYVGSFGGGV